MTFGPDVANVLIRLIGNENALGQVFNITTSETHTWKEILDFYCKTIYELTGKNVKVKVIDDVKGLQGVWNKWQIQYDRLYDRVFDNSKITSLVDYTYKPTYEGLRCSLVELITKKNKKWLNMNWRYEAWCDKKAGELTPLWEIAGLRNKAVYIKWRFFVQS